MSNIEDKIELIKKHIKSYPDFPKKGITFWDIFSVLQEPDIFQVLKDVLIETVKRVEPPVHCVAGLEARGFLFGPLIALDLKLPFVPIRKKGKLPGTVFSHSYTLEYGQDTVEMQLGSIQKGDRVLIIDDLLATGGSLKGACELIKRLEGEIAMCLVVIELEELKARKNIPADIISLIKL